MGEFQFKGISVLRFKCKVSNWYICGPMVNAVKIYVVSVHFS